MVGFSPGVRRLDMLQRVDGGVSSSAVEGDALTNCLRRVWDDAVVPYVCEPRLGKIKVRLVNCIN